MGPSRARRLTIVAALLLLPLLLATAHAGHGCPAERDCTTCRWAMCNVAEVAEPLAPLAWDPLVAGLPAEPAPRLVPGAVPAPSSRGPPLA